MSQYDAAATPMFASFMSNYNTLPYVARNSNININDKNTAYNDLMKKSNKFNFKKEDEIPEAAFNEVLWKAIKGSVQMPSPRHCGFVLPDNRSEKDDN
jgi:hypothetical protein